MSHPSRSSDSRPSRKPPLIARCFVLRANASSCSSRTPLARSCCSDFPSSAESLFATCLSRSVLARLRCQRCLHFDVALGSREHLLEAVGPLAFLAQGSPQLCRAFRHLLVPRSLLGCLRRRHRLGLDIAPRPRERVRQPAGPLALLPQGFSQFCGNTLCHPLVLSRLLGCLRLHCTPPSRPRGRVLLPAGPPVPLPQGFSQFRGNTLCHLLVPRSLLGCLRRQRRQGLDLAP